MIPTTTLTNHHPPTTPGCGLNPAPICREESEAPQNDHDTRFADLETLAAALDTWEQWARGKPVDTPTIRAAANQLAGNVSGGHQLAAIVDDVEHLPNQPTRQTPSRLTVRPGPELSL